MNTPTSVKFSRGLCMTFTSSCHEAREESNQRGEGIRDMSAHKGKKKRLGSRRRVAHLNETAEPEELPGTDRAPLAQWHIPEHGPDSPSLLLNPNHSQADSQHASSSEVLENNGGKGSSQQRPESAKDFATEQGHKPTEEVEENMGNETLEVTQRRQAVQDKTLMKLSPTNEHDILSVTQMYSAPMPEAELEKNVQEETRNDPIQSAADSVQVRENQHLFGTILSGGLSSHPTVNEQVIDETTMPQKQLPHASNAEIEKLHENKDLSWQDGVNQTKNLASEAHVDLRDMEPLATSEITTEKNSLGKRTEIENIEQAACFSPTVEQVEHSNFPEHSGEVALHENKVALTEVHQIKDSFEQIVHDVKEDADTCSANPMVPATICDREKSDLGVKDSDNSVPTQVLYPSDKQEENVTNTDESQISSTEISDTALNQLHEGGDQGMNYVQLGFKGFLGRVEEGESSLQTVPFGIDVPLESQSEDNRLRSEEQSDKSLNPMKSRRKFGSRRRNKGSYAKESADVSHESPEDIAGYIRDEAPFDTEEMSFTSETGVQEEVCDPVKENVPLGISESTSSKNKDEKEPENLQFVEEFTYSLPKKEEQTELFNFLEVKALQSSHDGDNNVPAHSDVCDTNASELIVKSIDDPATQQEALNPLDKQEEHNTKVNMAVLDQRDENPPNTEETQISSTEVPDSALSQVHEGEDQDVVDVKLSAEGFFSGVEKAEASLPTIVSKINATLESQSDDNPLKTEEETDNSFNPMRSRRKMGSSRRHKGSHHVKESVVEQFHESPEDVAGNIRDEESSATTERSFARETAVQEESLEPVLKEMDKLDRPQTDQVKESASVGVSEFTSSNLLSVSPCHQMMIDQSDSGEMQTEENLTHRVVTEIMESGEDQELFMECGHAQFLEEIFPSKEGEEHDENFSLSEGKELEIAAAADSDLHDLEIKGPQILESEHSESNIHDVPESSANRIVQSEISDTNESEVSVKSPTNSATQHKVVNPDDKQQKQPMKDNSMEVKVEGFLGRGEETGSLQTIQFKTDAPSESQNKDNPLSTEEETENSFNPMRSRRKMGSSRRHKGRGHIKESGADTFHESSEDVAEDISDKDPSEKTQKSFTIETTMQEESVETVVEDMDKLDITQAEGVNDWINDSTPDNISEFTSSNLMPLTEGNPWVLVQSDTKEMPNEEIPRVSSETDIENKNEDFSKQPEKSFTRETEVKEDQTEGVHDQVKENVPVGVSEFTSSDLLSISPENKDEKDFSKQHENWQFDGETIFSSQKGEEQSEPFSLLEVKDLESPHESDKSAHDHRDICDTNASEPIVKSIGDSASQQEVLHLDDKQEKHNPKENIMEVSDQRDENPSITEETQISNTERPDTASLQVHEGEDQDVVDVKLSAEGFISGFEKAEASSPTIASEINAMLDSQSEDNPLKTEEETDNSFNPMRCRRKMGSSRRHKGRGHIKESGADTFHESSEDVAEDISDKDPSEKTQKSFTIETTMQEESVETVVEDMDKLDITQAEGVNDWINESTPDSISEFTSSNLMPLTEEDPWILVQSDTKEMPNQQIPSVSSETDIENKDGDFSKQPEKSFTGETEVKEDQTEGVHDQVKENVPAGVSEVTSSDLLSISPENKDEKDFSKQHENWQFVDETIFSSQIGEEQSEPFNLLEVKDLESPHESDKSAHDHSDICDTNASEPIVKSIGDSASQQEVLHLDDKQEKHNPNENIMEVSDQRDENLSITEETQISNTERPDTASLQVHEGEDQDVVDVKLSAEGFISGFEKAEASSPTIASEINAMLESHSEDNPLKTEEETDNSFNPMRSRRKMGSSRRHKRSQHAKESVAEAFHESPEYVAGNIKGKEPSVQTGGSFATETTVQEESLEPMQEMDKLDMSQSDQVKESVGISEFPSSKLLSVSPGQQVMIDQSRSDEMQTENNLTGGSVTENKEREEDQELFKESRHVKFLDEIFPSKEGEEHGENFSLFEGKELEIAADADSDLHNLEIKGPQIHESEHSESNIYDLTEFLDSSSANRIVQGEISVKSTADSAAQHKVLNPDDKQQEHHMKDNIMDVLDQREENASNTEESQISSTERTDTSLVQVHDSKDQNMDDVKLSVEGFLGRGEETEISHEDNPLSTEEETETFNLMKSRRKMGSSRRHKGRGHIKESGAETFHESSEDVAEDISDKDPSEKTQKSFTIETTMQEESVETVVEDMDKLDITQAEGVNDWINESTPDSISEFTSSNLMPLTEGNPWVLVQSDTKEMPNQQIPSVSSETDIENKNEGFSKQPEKSLPRETEVKEDQTEGVHDQVKENVPVGVSEFTSSDLLSISPENKDEKDFSKQHENWQFVDETIFSSQIGEEQSEPFNLLEVKDLESPHESDKSAHDHSDICDTNASEPIVKSIGDSASQQEVLHLDDKQEKHNPNENIMEVSDQRDENLSITEETQISNTERPDTALFQVHAGEDQDVKLGAEGFISGVDEAKSSLQTIAPEINAPLETQSECNPMSTEEETENSFTPMKSRRKMGSSRRHKGRGHAKESGADTFHESSEDVAKNISDEDPSETTERAFTIEATIQEKSVETVVEDMDKLDITQTEGDNDQIKESTPDSIMPLSEGDPSVLVQSDSKEMPNEELLSVYAVTDSENKERDEDEDLPRHTQDDYQSLLKAEGVVFANMSETTNEIEYSVEKENMSSPNGKQSAKEEDDEHLKLSRVKDAQPSVGDLNNVYQQEIKPMEMQGAHSSGSSLLEESTSSQTSLPGLESPLDSQSQGNPGLHKLRGNKRKLGSSRRIKGSHVRAESPTEPNVAKNTTGDGSSDTVPFDKMPTETTETDANSVTEEGKMISIENDKDESKEPMQEEDTTLPLNIGDNTSGNDDSLKPTEEEIQIEPDILSHLTGHDSIKVEVVDDSALGDNKETREKELYTVTETEDEKKEEQRDADQKDIGERHEDSPDEPFSVSRIKTETLLLLDVGIGEDTSEPAVDSSVDGESPKAESPHKKYPTQTKRKLGSTRRSQLHRKPEEGMDNSNTKEMDFNADVQHFGTMGEAEEAPLIVSAEVLQNQKAEPPLTTVHEVSTDQDLQRKPSSSAPDLISSTENVMSFLSEKPSSLVEEVNNFFQAPDIKDGHAHTGDTLEQQTRQEDINVTRGQDNLEVAAQESKYMSEEGDDTEMQSESLNLTNRRRKMGSTRKGLRAARDEENLHHLQGVNNEATDAVTDVDILTESVSGVEEEEEPKANDEHKDSKTSGEKAEQRAGERAVSGQLGEIEHHLAPLSVPSLPDASPSLDTMSESTPGRRRRKMGSHRKSHGHDTPTETEPGSALKTIMDESLLETQEQRGPDNKSQVEEGSKKSLLNISPSETGELSAPVTRNKAPQRVAAPQHPTVNPGQKSGISIADSSTENSYNVVMVGDSGVGKTSFMKRAQSGKFSLDIPSSIGLDTCMWTVLIDGKPVVLQLWDTAGQERFHSITRQVFHRAQAFLLMYDISSSQTFTAIRYWAECIQEGAMENVPILLVGNKSDHAKRQVTPEEGETLAKEHNFDFMECSAATGDNVVQSLETVARLLKQRADRREEPLVLLKDTQRKASGCC